MIRRRVIVHGAVQGVGFRYTAELEALRLGIAGWIRNRADGSVEAEVEGDDSAVAAMVEWLSVGPRSARVTGMDSDEIDLVGEHGFRVTA